MAGEHQIEHQSREAAAHHAEDETPFEKADSPDPQQARHEDGEEADHREVVRDGETVNDGEPGEA